MDGRRPAAWLPGRHGCRRRRSGGLAPAALELKLSWSLSGESQGPAIGIAYCDGPGRVVRGNVFRNALLPAANRGGREAGGILAGGGQVVDRLRIYDGEFGNNAIGLHVGGCGGPERGWQRRDLEVLFDTFHGNPRLAGFDRPWSGEVRGNATDDKDRNGFAVENDGRKVATGEDCTAQTVEGNCLQAQAGPAWQAPPAFTGEAEVGAGHGKRGQGLCLPVGIERLARQRGHDDDVPDPAARRDPGPSGVLPHQGLLRRDCDRWQRQPRALLACSGLRALRLGVW